MGTLTIKSNKNEYLHFLDELARRLGMNSYIEIDNLAINEDSPDDKPVIPTRVADDIAKAIYEIKEFESGNIELMNIDELLDELKS